MAPADLRALEQRARDAYERARWRRALVNAWPVAALLALAVGTGVTWSRALPFALANLIVATIALQRGRELGRAVITGWIAGSVPLVVSLLACRVPHACVAGTCYQWCVPACMLAGAIAGVWVMRRAMRSSDGRTGHALVGAAIACTTGAIGCMALGLGGTLGMLVGVALASAPAWALGHRSR